MNKNGMTDTGTSTANHGVEERIDQIKDTVKGFVDHGAQRVDAIKSKVVDVKDQAFSRGNDLVDRVTDMVKAHPLKAVAIAFGAGYLGMRLFRR
jgi:ElaB/YqjD/DUF883 family membrane-anchored ribosome-binding protein